MDDRKIAVLAGVTTLVSAGTRAAPDVVISRLLGDVSGLPAWLQVGSTVGESVLVLSMLARFAGPLVAWAVVLGVGYYIGGRVDVRREYRGLARALAGGSLGTLALVGVGATALEVSGGPDLAGLLVVLLGVLAATVEYAVPVVLGGLAGAAVASVERERTAGRSSTGHRAEGGAGSATEAGSADGAVRERAVEDAD